MKQAILGHLRHCDDRDKFPRFLPAETIVAHKTGSTERVRNDASILFLPDCAVAICVLTADNEDTRGDADNAGTWLCAKVAKEGSDSFHKSFRQPLGISRLHPCDSIPGRSRWPHYSPTTPMAGRSVGIVARSLAS
jgi:hypothetical protein